MDLGTISFFSTPYVIYLMLIPNNYHVPAFIFNMPNTKHQKKDKLRFQIQIDGEFLVVDKSPITISILEKTLNVIA
ncbi:hypothetical protein [Thalassobellus suaedae]|uniref:Uncharacterized protein n=1 Tax=Thalassobellus suaedae TaxID=3074124 RepID=A0ABY9XW09_9FLAO|nr:hypothetical protein RHP51_05455 [Flavobacteriaceae bacterium HL-DH14]